MGRERNKANNTGREVLNARPIARLLGEMLPLLFHVTAALATNPTHYGDPKLGCMGDEQEASITGIPAGHLLRQTLPSRYKRWFRVCAIRVIKVCLW